MARGYNTHGMELVYRDEYGTLYEQSWTDLQESGTLIDPETGDDLELIGWKEFN